MIDIKRITLEKLTIGTISVLRTLVELDQAGAIDLPVDDFAVTQRDRGDPNQLADAIEAIREHISGSVAVKHGGDH
jgi:predicted lipoprotein